MHKSLKNIALAGSAMAFAMTPALVTAQEQVPAPAQDRIIDTLPETATPPSMPDPAPPIEQSWDDGTTAAPASPATTPPPAAEQEALIQSWPADRQDGYKAWPTETRSYFWSLGQQRQDIFWALSDSDKVTLSQMPEAQSESTWAQIESRLTPPRG